MKFSELDKKTQIKICTTPHCVFVTPNPDDETYEQIVERQDKFLKLPEKIKNKLLSLEVSKKIQNIGKHYKLSLLQMASIARMIRNYYFRELEKEDFASTLIMEAGIEKNQAEKISRYVIDAIIEKDDFGKNLKIAKKKIPIKLALEKYPEIRSQILTNKPIKLLGRSYQVKGTVGNWIEDYYNIVGANNHDIMKRSRYLFNGENCKKLNSYERQKLTVLLKALDENLPVEIDIEMKEILFNKAKTKTSDQKIIRSRFEYKNDYAKINEKRKGFFDVTKKRSDISTYRTDGRKEVNLNKNGVSETENKKEKIIHIKRGNFGFNSNHFESDFNKKKKIVRKIFGEKRKNLNSNGGGNISFSFSQQFPVEKKQEENYLPKFNKKNVKKDKKKIKDNFFGKISPIDE